MTTNIPSDIRVYHLALRETAHLDDELAACLFLILTTLTRAHEVTSTQARTTADGCLEIRNIVGLNDVRIRQVPLAMAALGVLGTSAAGVNGAAARHPTGSGLTPLTLQRLFDDAEGVGGVQHVDQLWQIALRAVIASDPANLDAALAYAGIRPRSAPPVSPDALRRVADVIDRLVIEAGFGVESIDACATT
jgi:hypothetical protein